MRPGYTDGMNLPVAAESVVSAVEMISGSLGESVLDTVLEPLMKRPDLPQLVATLNEELQRERALRETFLRELTPNEKAEFIGGERILHSPARAAHIRAAKRLLKLMDEYVMKHNLGEVFFEKALVHLTRNDYEPDVLFYGKDKASQITPDQILFPAPDFIAEILSDSTESRDRGIKFLDYALHGVAEYWIVDADEEFFEQYTLVDQHYKLLRKQDSGLIASIAVAGFEIPVAAIFDDDAHRAAMRSLLVQ